MQISKQIIIGVILAVSSIHSNATYAQKKYESESRLKESEVPAKARDFIEAIGIKKKIKWYVEEGLDRTSIEAKFKFNNHKHSIEFDTTGQLEDAEIIVKWSELSKDLQASITTQLKTDCRKYKVRKTQIQYTGDRYTILSKIKTGKSSEDYIVSYEMIVKCCNKKEVALFEYLFSNTGEQLSVSQIVFKNSSNLEY